MLLSTLSLSSLSSTFPKFLDFVIVNVNQEMYFFVQVILGRQNKPIHRVFGTSNAQEEKFLKIVFGSFDLFFGFALFVGGNGNKLIPRRVGET